MNILYLCDEYPPCLNGGIGTATQLLARELVRKGHSVFISGFYPYYRRALPYEVDNGVRVFRYFYGNRLSLKISENSFLGKYFNIKKKFGSYVSQIRNLIIKYKLDIIEIPSFNESFRYSGTQIIEFPDFGIPMIVKYHGTYSDSYESKDNSIFNDYTYKKEAALISKSKNITALSEFSKRNIIELFNPETNIKVIYNGINLGERLQYNENTKDSIVTFAGTISENKGIFNLLKAWELVILKIPSAKLIIYGKGSETQMARINQILNDKTKPTIEFKGFVKRETLPQIYCSSSCAIFPSFRENFSMAPMEAMMVGCPTIFTKRASGSELIDEGENGLLIDPGNIQEITDAIVLLLSNRKYAIELGKKGKKTIEEKFSIPNIADANIRFYKNCIQDFKLPNQLKHE